MLIIKKKPATTATGFPLDVLKKMLKVIETANLKINDKKVRLESTVSLNSENHYKDEKEWLKECDQILNTLTHGGV